MTAERRCAMLVYDRKETARTGTLVIRECGARAANVLTLRGDAMFRVCHRHDSRLERLNASRSEV